MLGGPALVTPVCLLFTLPRFLSFSDLISIIQVKGNWGIPTADKWDHPVFILLHLTWYPRVPSTLQETARVHPSLQLHSTPLSICVPSLSAHLPWYTWLEFCILAIVLSAEINSVFIFFWMNVFGDTVINPLSIFKAYTWQWLKSVCRLPRTYGRVRNFPR